jgi:CBS domain-containing protein
MDKTLTVLQAKRYGVYSCVEEDTLLEVSRRMVAEDVSALVVLDQGGSLAGVISHTDLVQAALEDDSWTLHSVASRMSREVVTVTPDATLAEVGRLLLEHCIHRIVVVDGGEGDQKVPVAVIASSDLVYHMVKGVEETKSP